jgi:peptidase YpeB-like protein
MKLVIIAIAALCVAQPALAQGKAEKPASEAEAAKVRAVIAKIGCKAEEIEKESDRLFEIDDAQCEIGQYDIKVNGDYKIISITSDE